LVEARDSLDAFYQAIDERLRIGKQAPVGAVIALHMSYQASLLLIHRPYLHESADTGLYAIALRVTTASAAAITRLIHIYRKTGHFRQAPFWIVHHVLTAAIMHLLATTTSKVEMRQQAVSRFRVCCQALQELETTWPRARKSIRQLQVMAKRWKVVSALPIELSFPLDVDLPVTFDGVGSIELLRSHINIPEAMTGSTIALEQHEPSRYRAGTQTSAPSDSILSNRQVYPGESLQYDFAIDSEYLADLNFSTDNPGDLNGLF